MRADRLVSLVLLLRHRGRCTAAWLATELEVSQRTILRDIEALSAAGVPVYTQRGPRGGLVLDPGFRSQLAGLNEPDLVALLIAASAVPPALGVGAGLRAGVLKLLDAMPASQRAAAGEAAARVLVRPRADALARPLERPDAQGGIERAVAEVVTAAVLRGKQVEVEYRPVSGESGTRVLKPLGLVHTNGLVYLLATRDGHERSYRLDRMESATLLPQDARRPEGFDLPELWARRTRDFREAGPGFEARLCLSPSADEAVAATAVRLGAPRPCTCAGPAARRGAATDGVGEPQERLHRAARFQDEEHAGWAAWDLAPGLRVLGPCSLRAAVLRRAEELMAGQGATAKPGT